MSDEIKGVRHLFGGQSGAVCGAGKWVAAGALDAEPEVGRLGVDCPACLEWKAHELINRAAKLRGLKTETVPTMIDEVEWNKRVYEEQIKQLQYEREAARVRANEATMRAEKAERELRMVDKQAWDDLQNRLAYHEKALAAVNLARFEEAKKLKQVADVMADLEAANKRAEKAENIARELDKARLEVIARAQQAAEDLADARRVIDRHEEQFDRMKADMDKLAKLADEAKLWQGRYEGAIEALKAVGVKAKDEA